MLGKTYRLPFRLVGIPLNLDLTFLLALPFFAWMIASNIPSYIDAFGLDMDPEALRERVPPIALGLVAALGLFASVVIHELGHCLVGRRLGMEAESITLWILGGLARFRDISDRPGHEALMAIAGPLTSYALAGLCWLASVGLPEASTPLRFILVFLFWMNLVLATFNLLPAFPLDGGRVLRSLLALRRGRLEATQQAVGVSRVVAVGLGLLGLASGNLLLVLVAFFILLAGSGEAQLVAAAALLADVRVKDLMSADVKTVGPDLTVGKLLEKMLTEKHLAYPVLDESGKVLGMVTLRDLETHLPVTEGHRMATVGEVLSSPVGAVLPEDSAFHAFKKIAVESTGRLVVLGVCGELLGIVSKTDLLQALQLRRMNQVLGHA